MSQGGSNDLQRLEAHRPPMVRGGVDSRVRTTMTTEGEVDVMRGIQDMGAGTKRKGNQPSSSSGKKQKASCSQGFQSPGYLGQGRARVARRAGHMFCFHCQQPGHMRRDNPQRQGSQGFGTTQSQSAVGQERTQFVPPPFSMGQGNQYQFQGAAPTPSTSQTGHIGQDQSVGQSRGQDLQAKSSDQVRQMTCYHCRQSGHMRRDCLRRQRSQGTTAEYTGQPDMQGTFLL